MAAYRNRKQEIVKMIYENKFDGKIINTQLIQKFDDRITIIEADKINKQLRLDCTRKDFCS